MKLGDYTCIECNNLTETVLTKQQTRKFKNKRWNKKI